MNLLPKMVIECVVPDHLAKLAVHAVIEAARTGEVGDGRVFVTPVFESWIAPGKPSNRQFSGHRVLARVTRASVDEGWQLTATARLILMDC